MFASLDPVYSVVWITMQWLNLRDAHRPHDASVARSDIILVCRGQMKYSRRFRLMLILLGTILCDQGRKNACPNRWFPHCFVFRGRIVRLICHWSIQLCYPHLKWTLFKESYDPETSNLFYCALRKKINGWKHRTTVESVRNTPHKVSVSFVYVAWYVFLCDIIFTINNESDLL